MNTVTSPDGTPIAYDRTGAGVPILRLAAQEPPLVVGPGDRRPPADLRQRVFYGAAVANAFIIHTSPLLPPAFLVITSWWRAAAGRRPGPWPPGPPDDRPDRAALPRRRQGCHAPPVAET